MGHVSQDDLDYQARLLEKVSRTFALTIPELPEPLRTRVGNAYLLCRIADTIEDDPELKPAAKRAFSQRFIAVVRGQESAEAFAADVTPALAKAAPGAERELVGDSARVAAILNSFDAAERAAVERCVMVMADGMAWFQERGAAGVGSLQDLAHYCYVVAGCVGEMLTELFCLYSPAIARHRGRLMELAVSFGQGLQMTNILKDVWEDRRRGQCWLPKDVFAARGVDLGALSQGAPGTQFHDGLRYLAGVARWHLARALEYTLLVPPEETGIRRFCLWALFMAVLTLRKICRTPGFTAGSQVKISRRAVRAVIYSTSACGRWDRLLRGLFSLTCFGLPHPVPAESDGRSRAQKVSGSRGTPAVAE